MTTEISTDHVMSNPILTGNIRKQVLRLAWPTMLAMVLETFFSLVDAFWVGKLGADALAAVSGSSFILWAVYSVSQIASTGITTLVAQNLGAGQQKAARVAAGQGLILALSLGAVIGIFGIVIMPFLFRIMNLSLAVGAMAYSYLGVYLGGIFLAFVYIAGEAVFRASGDTRTPMLILGSGLLLNAILDPFLIFGYLFFPALGVAGAAWATIISYCMVLIIALYVLWSRDLLPALKVASWLRIQFKLMWTMCKIGAPVAISGVSFSVVYILLTRVINHFGTASLAALGMGHRLEGIAYLASVGFSIAASTLVGQNVGAGNHERAARAAWLSTFYGALAMSVFSFISVFFAPYIIALFISDPEVVLTGSRYLYIIACCEVFLAFEIVLEGAFAGAGDTVPPMLVSIPITALRMPAAWFFAIYLGWGIEAIWWVISLSTMAKGVLIALWFYRGNWRKKSLVAQQPPDLRALAH